MKLRSYAVAVALVLAATASGPSYAAGSASTKLYLLASDDDFLYWSPDAGDPELAALSARRGCGGLLVAGLCPSASAGGYYLTLPFMPAAVLDSTVGWGEDRPLRFHLEMAIDSATPATVHALAFSSVGTHESAAATEVAPGIFEGTISTGHEVSPPDSLSLGIRIRVPFQARAKVGVEVRTAGQSWIEFPEELAVRSVPELLANDSYRAAPSSYATPDRSFRFNDRNWETFTFSGNLDETRTFTVPLERSAAAVVGWVEGFSKPFVHGLLNGDTGARPPLDTAFVALVSNGSELARHRYSAAAVDVPNGTLGMKVEPIAESGPREYRAHVMVAYGVRTLAAMRWRFEVPAQQHRLPALSSCAVPLEQVPATTEVTTFRVDLEGRSPSPLPKSWALVFSIPDFIDTGFCNTIGGGGGVRFAVGGPRVALVGPAPSPYAITLSAFDTEFEAEVRYAYTAPPPCEQPDPPPGCESTP